MEKISCTRIIVESFEKRIWSPNPSSRAKSRAHGFSVIHESGPHSTTKPCVRTVSVVPEPFRCFKERELPPGPRQLESGGETADSAAHNRHSTGRDRGAHHAECVAAVFASRRSKPHRTRPARASMRRGELFKDGGRMISKWIAAPSFRKAMSMS